MVRKCLVSVLALTLVASLCSCSLFAKETASSSTAPVSSQAEYQYVDTAAYAEKGEIYGCQFALHTSHDEILAAYPEEAGTEEPDTEESEGMPTGTELTVSGEDPIRMMTGEARYYYHPQNAEQGIAYIAYFDDPYSYLIGLSTEDEIRRTIGAEPTEAGTATAEELFFYFGVPESITFLRFSFGTNILTFYFENGTLSATTLYDPALWTVPTEE